VLIGSKGAERAQPWLGQHRDYAVAAALIRAADLDAPEVRIAWVVPDATEPSDLVRAYADCLSPLPPRLDPASRPSATGRRFALGPRKPRFSKGAIITVGELRSGAMASTWPDCFVGMPPPDGWPEALAAFVSKPDPRERAAQV
jgi:hypothetical protein